MILIIDGYNLIKQVIVSTFIEEELRYQFVSRLNVYAQAKKLNIILIFDGGERGRQAHGSVQVIYAGVLETADDVILKLLRNFGQRGLQDQILLITGDRELISSANLVHIDSLSALDFYNFLLGFERVYLFNNRPKGEYNYEIYSSKDPELDKMMLAGSQSLLESKLSVKNQASNRQSAGKQASKLARKLQKKIDKL